MTTFTFKYFSTNQLKKKKGYFLTCHNTSSHLTKLMLVPYSRFIFPCLPRKYLSTVDLIQDSNEFNTLHLIVRSLLKRPLIYFNAYPCPLFFMPLTC